jgi:uncharacterized protein YjiS (DUF1127 family)
MSATTFSPASAPAAIARPGRVAAFWEKAKAALAARATTTELAELDARLLRDIGVRPEQARAYVTRELWDMHA